MCAQADAEEVCTILQQAFQLVYTEATMEHFNDSITAGERGLRSARNSLVFVPNRKSAAATTELPSSPARREFVSPRRASTIVAQALMEESNEDSQGMVG